MRIGITGWNGFIGSALSKKLLDDQVKFVGNLTNLDNVKYFVSGCDRIYHIAGKNRDKEGNILANNIVATGNLLLACKLQKVSPEIVFLSSAQVEWDPDSEYGIVKRIEEKIVETAENWCIFRVPNVYGPGCKPFYNSVVATFAYQIAHGQGVIMNNPSETREFISIEGVVCGLLSPEFNEYVRPVGETFSIQEVYDYMTTRLGEHDGLKKCLDYYKEDADDLSAS